MTSAENPLVSIDEALYLVHRDDENYSIEGGDLPGKSIGSRAQQCRDDIVKDGKIVNVLLDPSKTQFLNTIKYKDNEVIQTTREHFKLRSDEEVKVTPQTNKECIKRCTEINHEHLQHIV